MNIPLVKRTPLGYKIRAEAVLSTLATALTDKQRVRLPMAGQLITTDSYFFKRLVMRGAFAWA
jgi:hypothetical protein